MSKTGHHAALVFKLDDVGGVHDVGDDLLDGDASVVERALVDHAAAAAADALAHLQGVGFHAKVLVVERVLHLYRAFVCASQLRGVRTLDGTKRAHVAAPVNKEPSSDKRDQCERY